MSNIIRIGKPAGHKRAVRLMTEAECIANRSAETLAEKDRHLQNMRDRMELAVAETAMVHGDGVAKTLMLDVARKFFPGG